MKKILALLFAALMLVSVLAACGEQVSAKVVEIDLTDELYAFGVDKTQPELLADVNAFIKQVKEDGTLDSICDKYFSDGTPTPVESAKFDSSKDQLVVATNASFEPFEYMKGDKYLGIDMELAKLLADYLGKELVIDNMDFDSVCLSVGQQKCDIAMAGLTVKPDREKFVTFSDTYYAASQRVIVKSDDEAFADCKTVEDVEKVLKSFDKSTKIGYQTGTTGQFYVEGDEGWGFDGYNVVGKGYKNGSLAVQDMLNGNIDYVIIDKEPANCITKAINKLG